MIKNLQAFVYQLPVVCVVIQYLVFITYQIGSNYRIMKIIK